MRPDRKDSSSALRAFPLPVALVLAALCTLLAPGGLAHAQAAVPAAPTGLTASAVANDNASPGSR